MSRSCRRSAGAPRSRGLTSSSRPTVARPIDQGLHYYLRRPLGRCPTGGRYVGVQPPSILTKLISAPGRAARPVRSRPIRRWSSRCHRATSTPPAARLRPRRGPNRAKGQMHDQPHRRRQVGNFVEYTLTIEHIVATRWSLPAAASCSTNELTALTYRHPRHNPRPTRTFPWPRPSGAAQFDVPDDPARGRQPFLATARRAGLDHHLTNRASVLSTG